jgi:L-2-hydroxycarboxylate dehydrogenase (NAD+)
VSNAISAPVKTAQIRALGLAALDSVGADPQLAATQVDHLLEADLQGRASHGMQRLPVLVGRIRNGLIDARATPTLVRADTGVIEVDGNLTFGPVAMAAALDALVEERRIGVAAIRRAGHIGILTPYLARLAEHGFASLVFTTSEALVHPAGGSTALVGTNPVGIGVPTPDGPLLVDLATSAISAGEIIAHAERGDTLPVGRAVGPDGTPTTDPNVARAGAISPFGGAKGYALGVGLELLVAGLTATALGADVKGTLDTEHPVTKGDLVIAIPVTADGGPLAAYLRTLRESPPAPGYDAVRVPGDRAQAVRRERERDGIPYPPATWAALTSLVDNKAGGSL